MHKRSLGHKLSRTTTTLPPQQSFAGGGGGDGGGGGVRRGPSVLGAFDEVRPCWSLRGGEGRSGWRRTWRLATEEGEGRTWRLATEEGEDEDVSGLLACAVSLLVRARLGVEKQENKGNNNVVKYQS